MAVLEIRETQTKALSNMRDSDLRIAIYTENAETVRAFWEWRHKVITIYFAALGAVFVVAGWMIDHKELQVQRLLWLPFALGAFFTYAISLMERTNRLVLRQCYALGKSIEEQVMEGGGIFYKISEIAKDPFIYTKVLRVIYPLTSLLFLGVALAVALWRR
jgi:hypothetical protein